MLGTIHAAHAFEWKGTQTGPKHWQGNPTIHKGQQANYISITQSPT